MCRSAAVGGASVELSWDEISRHCSADDCWVVIDSVVYDMTPFLATHPGGKLLPLRWAGKDATEEWNAIHGHKKEEILEGIGANLRIGVLATPIAPNRAADASAAGGTISRAAVTAGVTAVTAGVTASGSAASAGDPPSKGATLTASSSGLSGGTSHLLPAERANATFETELMTNTLDGGAQATARRRWYARANERWDFSDKGELSREALLAKHFEYFGKVHAPHLERLLAGEWRPEPADYGPHPTPTPPPPPPPPHTGKEEQVGCD